MTKHSKKSESTSDEVRHKHRHKHKHKHRHKHGHKHKHGHRHKHKHKHNDLEREEIDEAHYYNKNAEFRVWLLKKGKHFDSCPDARTKYFPRFVEKWNRGELESMYYTGDIPHDVKVEALTGYKWGFEKKMNEQEKLDIEILADKVEHDTEKEAISAAKADLARRIAPPEHLSKRPDSPPEVETRLDVARYKRKRERQRDQSIHEVAVEEAVPKNTGREREIEKRKEKSARIHGSAKEREEIRDSGRGYEDSFLFGDDGDTLDHLKRKHLMRDLRKQEITQENRDRAAEARKREQERINQIKQDYGLDAGAKITIQPRNE